MLDWINSNREWLFDGVGAVLLSLFISAIIFILNKLSLKGKEESPGTERVKQVIKSGKNSTNIQSGQDITFNYTTENKR